jgi:CubicO group peptidase (beta-lactamase class C family)
MKKKLTLLLLCLWIFQQSFAQQHPSPEIQKRIKQVEEGLAGTIRLEGESTWTLKDRMEFHKVPGVSIAVIHNYKIEWAAAYGWADKTEKRPVTTGTLFQAASISKSLNGVGVLKLAQDNKLDLNTDINSYLKSWKFPYDSLSKNKKITLTNLLSHTAGLTVHGFRGYAKGEQIPTMIQVLNGETPANNAPVRSQFEPDLRVQYSGGGTTISQLIVTDVTGLAYEDYMRKNVLIPMGMTSSFYRAARPEDHALLATGYRNDGNEVTGKFHIYPEQAAASLWTNPTDLAAYIIETQRSLQGESAKVLSQKFTKLRLTPYKGLAGLGVFINNKGNAKYFEHGGGNEGFRCHYSGNFENGNGVVVMVNSDNGVILQEIMNSVATVYGWKDFYNPQVKKIYPIAATDLKKFEGYYKSANSENRLHFSVRGDQLQLKQLWDGREILFLPESDLDFFNKDFPFPLRFSKDTDNNITEVLAFNRDVWKRDMAFKPIIRKAITLPSAELKSFEGKYRLQRNNGFIVEIVATNEHLLVKQLWDGQQFIFLPESALEFFAKDNEYFPIRFTKNNNGEVTQALAFNRDVLEPLKE